MTCIKNEVTINAPVKKIWDIFSNVRNFPKYFKYVNKVFYKGDVKLGAVWHDLTTFIFLLYVKHTVTVFEKEKILGFDVKIFTGGFIKERVLFEKINEEKATKVKISVCFDFNNSILSFLFDKYFEKRMTESISKAIVKAKEELEI
jgi:uncharacterized membrane protein